ncbi:MAG: hypothetical protein ACM3ZA_06120 [Bacillota bacterium]
MQRLGVAQVGGERRLRVRLTPEEAAALERLRRGGESDADIIRRLIREREGDQALIEALARIEARLARLEAGGLQIGAPATLPGTAAPPAVDLAWLTDD